MTETQQPFETNKLLTIDESDYRAAKGLNQSAMPDLLDCPKRYKAKRDKLVKDDEGEALIFGRLLHMAVLEPERFKSCARHEPDVKLNTKTGKDAMQEFREGLTAWDVVVPRGMGDKVFACRNAINADPIAAALLRGQMRTEQSVFWHESVQDESSLPVLCKARLDAIRDDGLIIDIKTARDASPEGFKKAVGNCRYDLQVAHYLAASRHAGAPSDNAFVYICVEKEPPYLTGVYLAGLTIMDCGEKWRQQAIQALSHCERTNTWPGYTPEIAELEMPSWMWREGT